MGIYVNVHIIPIPVFSSITQRVQVDGRVGGCRRGVARVARVGLVVVVVVLDWAGNRRGYRVE